jgi:hypothetical protein
LICFFEDFSQQAAEGRGLEGRVIGSDGKADLFVYCRKRAAFNKVMPNSLILGVSDSCCFVGVRCAYRQPTFRVFDMIGGKANIVIVRKLSFKRKKIINS